MHGLVRQIRPPIEWIQGHPPQPAAPEEKGAVPIVMERFSRENSIMTTTTANLVRNGRFTETATDAAPAAWEVVRPDGLPPIVEVGLDRNVRRADAPTLRLHGTAGDSGVVRLRQELKAARPV